MVTNNSSNIPTAASGKVLQGAGVGSNCTFSTPTYPSSSGTSGKVLISDGTNNIYSTPTFPNASATSGKIIVSDGTNWIASTPTFPNASASSGKFIRSDGTNWIASTPTLPTSAGTSGKVLQSDGTNYVESTPTYPSASGSTGTILRSDGTNNVYTTATYPATTTINQILYSSAANTITGISTVNSAVLSTNSSGVPSLAATPACYIYMSANQTSATGDGTIATVAYNTAVFDIGSNFNTTTHTWTAPSTGQFIFNIATGCSSLGSSHTTIVYFVTVTSSTFYSGTNEFYQTTYGSNPVTQNVISGSILMQLNSGDTVVPKVQVSGGTKSVTINLADAFFAAYQLR